MTTKMVFHGSDIEKICAYYHLNKEDIVKFGANVNPLGLSASVKKRNCRKYRSVFFLSRQEIMSASEIRLLHTVRFLQNLFFREMAPAS